MPLIRNIVAPLLALALATVSVPAQEAPADLVQSKLEKWVETKKAISKEKSDWEAKKATLKDLNEIRLTEIQQLGEFVEAAETRIAEIDEKRSAFSGEDKKLKTWRRELTNETAALETELRPLLNRLPPPLREKVAESAERVEASGSDTPLQTRVRDVLLILQAVMEFQNTVTVDGDVREVGGERREIDILYLGLSGAWFCDRTGSYGGVGKVTADGWQWVEDKRVAAAVRKTIDVHRRDLPPELVKLPFPSAE